MKKQTTPIKYDGSIFFRDQARVIALIHRAAREANVKPSSWLRSAALLSLSLQGFDTTQIGGGK